MDEYVESRDHSLYTKYPAAADLHHFQNLDQAFNNRVVRHIQKHVDSKRPNHQTKTGSERAHLQWSSATKAQRERELSDYNNFQSFKARLMGTEEEHQLKNKPTQKLPGLCQTLTP